MLPAQPEVVRLELAPIVHPDQGEALSSQASGSTHQSSQSHAPAVENQARCGAQARWVDWPFRGTRCEDGIAACPQQLSKCVSRERRTIIVALGHLRVPQPASHTCKAPSVQWL